MTFIERHIGFLALAIGAVIMLRVFMITDANAFRIEGFDKGLFHYREWLSSSTAGEGTLAFKISQTLIRQRSGQTGLQYDQNIFTGSTGASPASAESTADVNTRVAAANSEKPDPQKSAQPAGAAGDAVSQTPSAETSSGNSETERTLLERLGVRRSELEKREQDLLQREALLKAAEQRLSDRNAELKKLEADLKARVDQRNTELTSLKPIVTMYETMKPKDAARLFDKLDFPILLSVSTAMNPRKLSEVLALMDPALAGRLTQAMSTVGRMAVLPDPSAKPAGDGELPDLSPQGTP